MSTPNTPMERALAHAETLYPNKRRYEANDYIQCTKDYLAGDADRERIMREEASRGFDDNYVKDICIRFALLSSGSWVLPEAAKAIRHIIQETRADRAELVACVLEMAEIIENPSAPYDIRKYASLIKNLKAEVDK